MALLSLSLSSVWGKSLEHEVVRGDQLLKISSKYYGTVKKAHLIVAANPGIDPNQLTIGDSLVIPDPVTPKATKSAAKATVIEEQDEANELELRTKEARYWKEKYLQAFSRQDSMIIELKEENKSLQNENQKLERLVNISQSHLEKKEKELTRELSLVTKRSETLQTELTRNQDRYQSLSIKYDELRDWKQERHELMSRVNQLTEANKRLIHENENLSAKGDIFVKQALASDEEFILREKGRILSERLWIEKNRTVSECKVQLTPSHGEPPKTEDLLSLLTKEFGAKNFFIDPSENKVIIRIPGDSVVGVDSPRLRQRYQVSLSKIAGFMKNFAIRSAQIETHDPHKGKIINESDEHVAPELVHVKQSKTILDYLSKKVFIPQTETALGKGSLNLASKKNVKYFDLSISFEKGALGSIVQNTPSEVDSTQKLVSNLLASSKLNVDAAVTQDGIIELDIPRDQIFGKSDQLRPSGKAKMQKILSLFSGAMNTGVEVLWAPGHFERNETINIATALHDLDKLKTIVNQDQSSTTSRVRFYQLSGRDAFRNELNPSKDKLERRIIVRVVPSSLGIRFAKL